MLKIIGGAILMMGSLWGGAYVLSDLDFRDWRYTPTVMTFALLCFAGIVILSDGIAYWGKKK